MGERGAHDIDFGVGQEVEIQLHSQWKKGTVTKSDKMLVEVTLTQSKKKPDVYTLPRSSFNLKLVGPVIKRIQPECEEERLMTVSIEPAPILEPEEVERPQNFQVEEPSPPQLNQNLSDYIDQFLAIEPVLVVTRRTEAELQQEPVLYRRPSYLRGASQEEAIEIE